MVVEREAVHEEEASTFLSPQIKFLGGHLRWQMSASAKQYTGVYTGYVWANL